MGILERVLRRLRLAGFPAELAFSGKKHTAVTQPVAAVHMGKVERGAARITVAVSILCPADMGGKACEEAGLRAVEALHADGADCTMDGCSYDGLTRCFSVEIRAIYAGMAGDGVPELGFSVRIDGERLPYALEFTAEEHSDHELLYSMWERMPKGIRYGCRGWNVTLVELIPAGGQEIGAQGECFTIQIEGQHGAETYRDCVWTSVKREYTRQGLKCTRMGLAMGREVS